MPPAPSTPWPDMSPGYRETQARHLMPLLSRKTSGTLHQNLSIWIREGPAADLSPHRPTTTRVNSIGCCHQDENCLSQRQERENLEPTAQMRWLRSKSFHNPQLSSQRTQPGLSDWTHRTRTTHPPAKIHTSPTRSPNPNLLFQPSQILRGDHLSSKTSSHIPPHQMNNPVEQ